MPARGAKKISGYLALHSSLEYQKRPQIQGITARKFLGPELHFLGPREGNSMSQTLISTHPHIVRINAKILSTDHVVINLNQIISI